MKPAVKYKLTKSTKSTIMLWINELNALKASNKGNIWCKYDFGYSYVQT